MSEKQVRAEENRVRVASLEDSETENENRVRVANSGKIKTRCYYTEYVNHMIRFYLTTPETLRMDGKKHSDIENWIAVQSVFYSLKPEDQKTIKDVYLLHHKIPEAVKLYCEQTGADRKRTWMLITRTTALIARRRGLI